MPETKTETRTEVEVVERETEEQYVSCANCPQWVHEDDVVPVKIDPREDESDDLYRETDAVCPECADAIFDYRRPDSDFEYLGIEAIDDRVGGHPLAVKALKRCEQLVGLFAALLFAPLLPAALYVLDPDEPGGAIDGSRDVLTATIAVSFVYAVGVGLLQLTWAAWGAATALAQDPEAATSLATMAPLLRDLMAPVFLAAIMAAVLGSFVAGPRPR